MRKIILLSLTVFVCWTAISYAGIYRDGVFWTIDANGSIINKNGYPPDEKLLKKNNQTCVFTEEDIPFDKAEYKNGKVIKRIKTTQEIEDELKASAKADEFKVIYKRMKKIAIDQLEAEGIKFFYDHLDE